jgi:hypothetical protein
MAMLIVQGEWALRTPQLAASSKAITEVIRF